MTPPAELAAAHQDRTQAELLGGHLLQVAEQGVRTGVGAGQRHAQPPEQRPEEREQPSRCRVRLRPSTVSMPE